MGKKYLKLRLSLIFILLVSPVFAQDAASLKSEIYSKLKCCPCKDDTFATCNCKEAREMKIYIDALLETNTPKDEIYYRVAKKFSINTVIDKQVRSEIEGRLLKEAGDKRPQAHLDAKFFDFGKVTKKQGKTSKTFIIDNLGNAPLVIKNIKSFCPCATASLSIGKSKSPSFGTEGAQAGWQAEISPKTSGSLEITIDLASSHVNTGKLVRDVLITSNDPIYPEIGVRVEADVAG